MELRIVHISDTHGAKFHTKLEIPECDVLIHSGDIGGRTSVIEVHEFLTWFEKQPAKKKIFVAGNHDICLDYKRATKHTDSVARVLALQAHYSSNELIKNYDISYLEDSAITYNGIKFYGSPYSPSFHKEHWAFNADRGEEISKIWAKIPSDTNVLITHTPVYGIQDEIEEKYKRYLDEDEHVGCKDLLGVIKKRLLELKLHCSGHIHDNYGCVLKSVSATRRVLFSNGAVINNSYNQLIFKPLIITI